MKLPYSEGSVFLVPLESGGYARGVVARTGLTGRVIFGYFFGPRLQSTTSIVLTDLSPTNASLRIRFGDPGLVNEEWPIIGSIPNWNRAEWPMPNFVMRDPLGRLKPRLVRYSDDDPNRVEAVYPIDDDTGLPTDQSSGSRAVEIKLNKILP